RDRYRAADEPAEADRRRQHPDGLVAGGEDPDGVRDEQDREHPADELLADDHSDDRRRMAKPAQRGEPAGRAGRGPPGDRRRGRDGPAAGGPRGVASETRKGPAPTASAAVGSRAARRSAAIAGPTRLARLRPVLIETLAETSSPGERAIWGTSAARTGRATLAA